MIDMHACMQFTLFFILVCAGITNHCNTVSFSLTHMTRDPPSEEVPHYVRLCSPKTIQSCIKVFKKTIVALWVN